jgi:hypothetical protein
MRTLGTNINGNMKLKNNDSVRFILWNLPACITCPFKTAHCTKCCYARKSERVYKNVLPARTRNYEESLKPEFVENMIYTIEKHLNSKAFRGKLAIFRIHESGDFYSVEYLKKWLAIIKHFENDSRIIFQCYTKSIPYFIECGYGSDEFPSNFIVQASVWDDTAPELLDLIKLYNFPVYTALSPEDMERATLAGVIFHKCRCSDCGTCLQCYKRDTKLTITLIH